MRLYEIVSDCVGVLPSIELLSLLRNLCILLFRMLGGISSFYQFSRRSIHQILVSGRNRSFRKNQQTKQIIMSALTTVGTIARFVGPDGPGHLVVRRNDYDEGKTIIVQRDVC